MNAELSFSCPSTIQAFHTGQQGVDWCAPGRLHTLVGLYTAPLGINLLRDPPQFGMGRNVPSFQDAPQGVTAGVNP